MLLLSPCHTLQQSETHTHPKRQFELTDTQTQTHTRTHTYTCMQTNGNDLPSPCCRLPRTPQTHIDTHIYTLMLTNAQLGPIWLFLCGLYPRTSLCSANSNYCEPAPEEGEREREGGKKKDRKKEGVCESARDFSLLPSWMPWWTGPWRTRLWPACFGSGF